MANFEANFDSLLTLRGLHACPICGGWNDYIFESTLSVMYVDT